MHVAKADFLERYFTVVKPSYIRHQYCGDLLREVTLPQEEYNVANDWYGPLHYLRNSNPEGALRKVLESLRLDGCLIIDPCMDFYVWEDIMIHKFPDWKFVYDSKNLRDQGALLILGPEHKIKLEEQCLLLCNQIEEAIRALFGITITSLVEEDAAIGEFGPAIRMQPLRHQL